MSTLNIEIEGNTDGDVRRLLKHIYMEICNTEVYIDENIEANCRTENNEWLVVNTNDIKGKYRWHRG